MSGLNRGWYFSPCFRGLCAFSGSERFLFSFILLTVFFNVFLQSGLLAGLTALYGLELAELLGPLFLKQFLLLGRFLGGVERVELCPAPLAFCYAGVAGSLPECFLVLALFFAFKNVANLETIDMLNPWVISGAFIGAMLPFMFSAFTMNSVGKAANKMIAEVRRQFKEKKGIMEGTEKPDYARCVSISTS
ncbi:MAG: sodium/proton-translocating pyrophosphatase, partial [Bacteroidales bacterium]|nr:sodium/proton-translocating pyrophosphatase [Bacteroidales bacterium]